MKYIALVSQKSPGCDYTIGCGKKWIELEADDKALAIAKLHAVIIGHRDDDYNIGYDGAFWLETKLAEVTLLEVSDEVAIPISDWYDKARELLADERKRTAELKERLEYVRLKDKYAKD